MVGVQLDSIHRPKVQSTMIIFTVALVVLGLFIRIFLARDGYYTDKLLQQILSVGIGIGVMLLAFYILWKYSLYYKFIFNWIDAFCF